VPGAWFSARPVGKPQNPVGIIIGRVRSLTYLRLASLSLSKIGFKSPPFTYRSIHQSLSDLSREKNTQAENVCSEVLPFPGLEWIPRFWCSLWKHTGSAAPFQGRRLWSVRQRALEKVSFLHLWRLFAQLLQTTSWIVDCAFPTAESCKCIKSEIRGYQIAFLSTSQGESTWRKVGRGWWKLFN